MLAVHTVSNTTDTRGIPSLNDPNAGKGADADAIEGLPSKLYKPGMFEDEEEPQCPICFTAYEEDEEIRSLPCPGTHHFHKACVCVH